MDDGKDSGNVLQPKRLRAVNMSASRQPAARPTGGREDRLFQGMAGRVYYALLLEMTEQVSSDLFCQSRGWTRDVANRQLFEPGVGRSMERRVPHKEIPEIECVL